jgi:hypothetical protein
MSKTKNINVSRRPMIDNFLASLQLWRWNERKKNQCCLASPHEIALVVSQTKRKRVNFFHLIPIPIYASFTSTCLLYIWNSFCGWKINFSHFVVHFFPFLASDIMSIFLSLRLHNQQTNQIRDEIVKTLKKYFYYTRCDDALNSLATS